MFLAFLVLNKGPDLAILMVVLGGFPMGMFEDCM